jgi:hypothetical protein
MLATLREAMAELPTLIREGVGRAVADGLASAAPAMAEQAAAAMAALRPGGNEGYVGRGGEWRPPGVIDYSQQPGGHLHGQAPPPNKRVERDPNAGRPIS